MRFSRTRLSDVLHAKACAERQPATAGTSGRPVLTWPWHTASRLPSVCATGHPSHSRTLGLAASDSLYGARTRTVHTSTAQSSSDTAAQPANSLGCRSPTLASRFYVGLSTFFPSSAGLKGVLEFQTAKATRTIFRASAQWAAVLERPLARRLMKYGCQARVRAPLTAAR